MAYEFANASRIAYLDKKEPAVTESYMGWSLGHWEGDTLVVDVTGLNDKDAVRPCGKLSQRRPCM